VNMRAKGSKQAGVTLLELMVAMGIFLVISGAMFGLLQMSQQRYASESQLSGSFQEARLALDQIVRDVNSSGYPSLGLFSVIPSDAANYAVGPVAWSPNYLSGAPCAIGTGGGGTCSSPGDFDLIVETNVGSGVTWIRYKLVETTLYRAVVPKTKNVDPATATSVAGVMVPFVENVMNNADASQIATITATYPSMFPGGAPQPVQWNAGECAGRGCDADRQDAAAGPAVASDQAGGIERTGPSSERSELGGRGKKLGR
jgi:prepilin-type N-terminal cleavage/methylation domain-containing protein